MLVMGDRRHRDDFAIIAGDRTCPLQDRDRHPVEIGGQFGKGKCMRRGFDRARLGCQQGACVRNHRPGIETTTQQRRQHRIEPARTRKHLALTPFERERVKVEQQRAIARHHSREHGQELRIARPPRHPGKLSGDIMGKRANPGHGLIIEQASRGKHDKPLGISTLAASS
jgi:hypothetical protein